jgi:hypothetical protein
MNDEQNSLIPIAEAGCAYLDKHPDASMIRVSVTVTGAADEIARLVSQAASRRRMRAN